MRNVFVRIATFAPVLLSTLALGGCPGPATYPPTITPIYAATSAGLYVFDGTTWNNITTANGLPSNNLTSVVVSGSGSGAEVFVGSSGGVSFSSGSTWSTWVSATDGLGSDIVNSLFFGSTSFYAATNGGLSSYNFDGSSPSWTNNAALGAINAVSVFGGYTYVAANSLHVFNGTQQEAGTPYPAGSIVTTATRVTAVLVDASQDVFAGTDQGLNVMNASYPFVPASPMLSGAWVYGLSFDSQGNLYAATSNGLVEFNFATSTANAILTVPVYCVSVDGAGTIYAGTNTGLETSTNGGSTWTPSSWTARVNAIVTTAPLYSF